MTIGIDIDGVLTDIEQYQLDHGSKYMWEKYQKQITPPNHSEVFQIFDGNESTYYDFWNEYWDDYTKTFPARVHASEVIQKLKEEGNQIIIITARFAKNETEEAQEEMKKIVKTWLKENQIFYDDIIFTRESKLEKCLDNHVDLMIEDTPENIFEIAEKIPVICFDAKYNSICEGNNIDRCYSWYDIYGRIQKMKYNQ